jgi:hypothetical protein
MYQNAQHQHQGNSRDCGQSWARGVRMLANYHKHTKHLFLSPKSCLRVCEEVFHFEFATVWLAEIVHPAPSPPASYITPTTTTPQLIY